MCLPLPAPPTPTASSRCSQPNNLISGGPRPHVSRLLPIIARSSIHPVYHGGHCLCVCVCVFVCVCHSLHPPPPTVYSRSSLPITLVSVPVTLTCVKIVFDPYMRLHPSVYHEGHCVCVCVFANATPPHPTASSRCSLPTNSISGWPRFHVSRLCPILVRGSIHPVYHEGHSVCVCVFAIASIPHPNCVLQMFLAH